MSVSESSGLTSGSSLLITVAEFVADIFCGSS